MAELYSALPRVKQKERQGIRESGHARRDTVERIKRSLEARLLECIREQLTNKKSARGMRALLDIGRPVGYRI